MYSDNDDPKGPGFPIRISPDQSSFAAPRSFSQRITSFIASRCQGIHQTPLRRLTDPTSNDQRPMPCLAADSRPDLRQDEQTRLGGTSRTPCGFGMTTSVTRQQTVSPKRNRSAFTVSTDPTPSRACGHAHCWGATHTSTPELDQHALHHVQKTPPPRGLNAAEQSELPSEDGRSLVFHTRSISSGPALPTARQPARWWAREDLNFRPHAYQARALTN